MTLRPDVKMVFLSAPVSAHVEGREQCKWNGPTLGPPHRPPTLDMPRDRGAPWPAWVRALRRGVSEARWTGQEKGRPPCGGLSVHPVFLGMAASLQPLTKMAVSASPSLRGLGLCPLGA